jgi:hypothetical protein
MDSAEAEALVDEQAALFEKDKDYLIEVWDKEEIDLDPNDSLGS